MASEDNSNANNFEEDIEDPPSKTLVHNILDLNFFYNFNNLISIQEYAPIGIFETKILKD